MKITTFDPEIISNQSEDAIAFFKELGFEKRHAPVAETTLNDVKTLVMRTRMKNADGCCVEVSMANQVPHDYVGIRMNVDNFDEAYNILTAHGFEKAPGVEPVFENNARCLLMRGPSGLLIDLIQHVKNEEDK